MKEKLISFLKGFCLPLFVILALTTVTAPGVGGNMYIYFFLIFSIICLIFTPIFFSRVKIQNKIFYVGFWIVVSFATYGLHAYLGHQRHMAWRKNNPMRMCSGNIAAVKSAVMMYNMDKGRYPQTLATVVPEFLDEIPISGMDIPTHYELLSDTHFIISCMAMANCWVILDGYNDIRQLGEGCP